MQRDLSSARSPTHQSFTYIFTTTTINVSTTCASFPGPRNSLRSRRCSTLSRIKSLLDLSLRLALHSSLPLVPHIARGALATHQRACKPVAASLPLRSLESRRMNLIHAEDRRSRPHRRSAQQLHRLPPALLGTVTGAERRALKSVRTGAAASIARRVVLSEAGFKHALISLQN